MDASRPAAQDAMRSEPTEEEILDLVNAALMFKVGTEDFADQDPDLRCPCCPGNVGEHLASCSVQELSRNLKPFLGAPDTCPELRPLILAAREVVVAFDGFDPEFCVLCHLLIENLKAKLIPFESLQRPVE